MPSAQIILIQLYFWFKFKMEENYECFKSYSQTETLKRDSEMQPFDTNITISKLRIKKLPGNGSGTYFQWNSTSSTPCHSHQLNHLINIGECYFVESAYRLDQTDANLPKIPVQPIGYDEAEHFLK